MSDDSERGGHGGPGHFSPGAIREAFEAIVEAIADRISQRMLAGRERMVSQRQSDLGPRRHREAVKRRLANGEGGAGVSADGRKYLLTPEAVLEELARAPESREPRASATRASEPPKSRARDISDFERNLMRGLRAVNDGTGEGTASKGKAGGRK